MGATGKVWKYGDNVDTDVITPGRYLNVKEPAELAAHCMEDIDRDFAGRVAPGDFIVAGKNFGCGSSRESAPIAIKACGVAAVIASSFARIFYRNAFNMGLPIFEVPEAVGEIEAGDVLEVDGKGGILRNVTRGREYRIKPTPPFMQELLDSGGLIEYVLARREKKE